MADKANKSSSIRLPEELRAGLKREAYERFSRGEPEPSYGELLLESWNKAKSITKSGDPAITEKSTSIHPPNSELAIGPRENPGLKSGEVQISVPSSDIPWVKKLLKVRHSKKPGLPHALENNMDEFVWADQAWDELSRHKSPLVSTEGARGSGPGATTINLPRAAGDRGHRDRDNEPDSDITRRIDAIEEAQRERQGRKKDPPGKTGTGR